MEENTSKVFVGSAATAFVDPLLAAAPSASASTPSTLFIINLCTSIAPVQAAGKTIPGFENHKLYQVARAEDGRTRHRLRLGFFTSEADAEAALASVRDNYPTAFVASLSDDDRRFARGYLPDSEATASWKRPVLVPKPAAAATEPVKAPTVAAPVAAATPAATVAKAAAKISPTPVPAKPSKAQPVTAPTVKAPVAPTPDESAIVEVSWEPEAKPAATAAASDDVELSWELPELETPKAPAAASKSAPQTIAPVFKTGTVVKAPATAARQPAQAKKPAPAPAEIPLTLEKEPPPATRPAAAAAPASGKPFHVGKGVEIPESALSLESSAVAPTSAPAARAAPAKASAPATIKQKEAPKAAQGNPSAAPAAPARTAAKLPTDNRPAPELDSTQTIRALTSDELNDDSQEKWFSIQLVVSERPVNLDAMPHLDIFEAYRVYSIANAGSGKIVYSLRLGFFREAVSAEAVSGYLRTFFPSPSVIRISAAEQTRFKDAPVPKATAAAKTENKVIELTHARDRKPVIPTVTVEVTDRSPTGAFKPGATGSFRVNASGTHKALKPAAKSAAPATRRSPAMGKSSSTGRYKAIQKRSLNEQLLDEAREVQLSESAIRKLPKNDSLLSRLVGKLTK